MSAHVHRCRWRILANNQLACKDKFSETGYFEFAATSRIRLVLKLVV